MKELKDVQEKYNLFMMIYKQGVNEYAPFYKVEKSGLMENVRAKKRRE